MRVLEILNCLCLFYCVNYYVADTRPMRVSTAVDGLLATATVPVGERFCSVAFSARARKQISHIVHVPTIGDVITLTTCLSHVTRLLL